MPIKKYLLAGLLVWTPLAITVAFFASWAATLGLVHHELEFWWELALLIVISGTAGSPLSIVVSVLALVFAVGLGVWGWRTIDTSLAK